MDVRTLFPDQSPVRMMDICPESGRISITGLGLLTWQKKTPFLSVNDEKHRLFLIYRNKVPMIVSTSLSVFLAPREQKPYQVYLRLLVIAAQRDNLKNDDMSQNRCLMIIEASQFATNVLATAWEKQLDTSLVFSLIELGLQDSELP